MGYTAYHAVQGDTEFDGMRCEKCGKKAIFGYTDLSGKPRRFCAYHIKPVKNILRRIHIYLYNQK
jgi:hypothetical protein